MKGHADLRIISMVEMDGHESEHLAEILERVQDAGKRGRKSLVELSMVDEDLLRRYRAALDESNKAAAELMQRAYPSRDEGIVPDFD